MTLGGKENMNSDTRHIILTGRVILLSLVIWTVLGWVVYTASASASNIVCVGVSPGQINHGYFPDRFTFQLGVRSDGTSDGYIEVTVYAEDGSYNAWTTGLTAGRRFQAESGAPLWRARVCKDNTDYGTTTTAPTTTAATTTTVPSGGTTTTVVPPATVPPSSVGDECEEGQLCDPADAEGDGEVTREPPPSTTPPSSAPPVTQPPSTVPPRDPCLNGPCLPATGPDTVDYLFWTAWILIFAALISTLATRIGVVRQNELHDSERKRPETGKQGS